MDTMIVMEDDETGEVTVCCLLCGAMTSTLPPDEFDEDDGFTVAFTHAIDCVLALSSRNGMIYN